MVVVPDAECVTVPHPTITVSKNKVVEAISIRFITVTVGIPVLDGLLSNLQANMAADRREMLA